MVAVQEASQDVPMISLALAAHCFIPLALVSVHFALGLISITLQYYAAVSSRI